MRIAIVNDLPMAAELLRRAVSLLKQHEVAWVAKDGCEAVSMCIKDTPDLILMDLIMPKMNGVEATRQIMQKCPCAILVVTISVQENAEMVFEAMGFGALDAMDTPGLNFGDPEKVSAPLLNKINSLGSFIEVFHKPEPRTGRPAEAPLVVIGASAGGPAAVAEILSNLPKDFPSPIVVIQHVDEQFANSLVHWLAQQSALPMRGACNGDVPRPGEVLMAAMGEHLCLGNNRRLRYSKEPKDAFYWPSVDVFFESVARHWQGEVIGVLLTGMGRDGAKGLKVLRHAGFHTIAQSQETCAVYGMPKAAIEIGAVAEILPLKSISTALRKYCGQPK